MCIVPLEQEVWLSASTDGNDMLGREWVAGCQDVTMERDFDKGEVAGIHIGMEW